MDPNNPNHILSPEFQARIAERKRQSQEAYDASPLPSEPDRDALMASLLREGLPRWELRKCDSMPEEDVRTLLQDWRALNWLQEHYPRGDV